MLLEIALDLAANCHKAYAKASPKTKRLLNQTFFEKVPIFSNDDERYAHAHLNPWTLVVRTSNVAENKAIGIEHGPTEVQAVEGEILQETEKARSEDLAHSLKIRTRMCKHTMVPRTGFEPVLPP